MGITGLIPFLEKSSSRGNISQFSGCTVAVDTYCWLHKGAFSCADKLSMGQETDAYVRYCMKFVNMLLAAKIKPILVFDGRHLPAKAETEVKRRESRESNRKRAAELMRMGQTSEGRNLLRRSLDVSHAMALEVIKQCQAQNVDCVVAPYEADAQLAYLNISGIADVVITEDSDLTLFGCTKIFFKMDISGYGLLVEQDRLHLAMGLTLQHFDMDKFRHMCILSGCDYLPSLPGIGLSKACKFIVKNTDNDIHRALVRLASFLNMKSLVVTKEYRDAFMKALVTFKHQLVYCPIKRKQVRLHPVTSDVTEEQLKFAGDPVDEDVALQLALGNRDPFTCEKLHNFDPDKSRLTRTNSWKESPVAKHPSIWNSNFMDTKTQSIEKTGSKVPDIRPSTRNHVTVLKTDALKNELATRKRNFEECQNEEVLTLEDMRRIYCPQKQTSTLPADILPESSEEEETASPVIVRRSNPFRKKTSPNEISPSVLNRARKRFPIKNLRFRPTVIDDTAIAQSKFFSTSSPNDEVPEVPDSMAVNIDDEDYKNNVTVCAEDQVSSNSRKEIIEHQEQTSNDSGFKGSSDERDIEMQVEECPKKDELQERIPLLDNVENITSTNVVIEEEDNGSRLSAGSDQDYALNSQYATELRSSLFGWEDSQAEKRPKRESSTLTRKSTLSSQGTSRRNSRTVTKKKAIIQGQQSLLNMFGFQKK